jgi:hypothetical protein
MTEELIVAKNIKGGLCDARAAAAFVSTAARGVLDVPIAVTAVLSYVSLTRCALRRFLWVVVGSS